MGDDQGRALERRDAFGEGWAAGHQGAARLVHALELVQKDLIQCQMHRALCVHEQDALRIANEALFGHTFAADAAWADDTAAELLERGP